MALTSEKIADLRLKHLEMVQAVVTRMAGYSATIKNFCITLVVAICGFSFTVQKPAVALLAVFTICIFAVLDAQYLKLERRFRLLYEASRQEGFESQPTFEINLQKAPEVTLISAAFSWSIGVFYIPLLLGVSAVFIFTWWSYGKIV